MKGRWCFQFSLSVSLSVHRGYRVGDPMWPLPIIHWPSLYKDHPSPGPWKWYLVVMAADLFKVVHLRKTWHLMGVAGKQPTGMLSYYHPPKKLWEGNVFTGVCLFTWGWVCFQWYHQVSLAVEWVCFQWWPPGVTNTGGGRSVHRGRVGVRVCPGVCPGVGE